MSKADLVQQILDELWRSFKRAGRGSITRTEKRLQVSHSYFKNWKARRVRVDLERLEQTLKLLDIDIPLFFQRALDGTSDVTSRFTTTESVDSVFLTDLWAREAETGLDLRATKTDPQWLIELDQARLDDPAAAAARAHKSISKLGRHPSEFARLAGIYGSCSRALASLKEAEYVLENAMRYADMLPEPELRAGLLQRVAVLEAEKANYAQAFAASFEAISMHALAGNDSGIGKTLFDMAGWYYHAKAYDQSILALREALERLPADEASYRFGAIMGLGFNYRAQGDPDAADEALRDASPLAPLVGKTVFASLQWLRGELAVSRGKLARAAEIFGELVSIYETLGMPLDQATATVELVAVKVKAGHTREALALARTAISLLAPLREFRIAQAAIAQLVNWGLAAERLSASRIDFLRNELKRQRAENEASARFVPIH